MENLKAKNPTANAHPKTNFAKELQLAWREISWPNIMSIFCNLYFYIFTNAKEYDFTKLMAYHIYLDKTGTSSTWVLNVRERVWYGM